IIERMLPEEISCISVDVDEDHVEIARTVNSGRANRQFQVMSLFDVPDHYESGSFDGAIISEVIEHVVDDVGALETAYRMIRPGGYLFLTVPNINRLSNRISRLIGRSVPEDPTHYREYEQNGIRQLVEQVGFNVEEMQGVYLLLPPENWSRKVIPVDCFLRDAVKWFPGWGRNIMLLCRKP
ncbi:MAG TPA: methyltransferase domain-containing protein, partial [bacterium]|nr:methyltransferase domain-containing protein [bacterium]